MDEQEIRLVDELQERRAKLAREGQLVSSFRELVEQLLRETSYTGVDLAEMVEELEEELLEDLEAEDD